jgi:hypothetical protein
VLASDSETPLTGGTLALALDPPPDLTDAFHQAYTKLDAAGVPIESAREDWIYSWFSTAGELADLHTRGTETDDWTVSGSPEGTPTLVAVVVRDLRGGVKWAVGRARVH